MTERLILVLAVLAAASIAYAWWSRREGRVTRVDEPEGALSSERLGAKRGFRATFVQFSTDTCTKCPPTAVLLRDIAAAERGVAHVEIDAAARMDLTREFDVMRTPTIVVLNHEGLPVARISGAPSREQAESALAEAPPPNVDYSI